MKIMIGEGYRDQEDSSGNCAIEAALDGDTCGVLAARRLAHQGGHG